MKRIVFYLFIAGINLFRLVPFWLLYFFGWLAYLLVFYIFKYRRKVVYTNLCKSFPLKSNEEINRITKLFFKTNLADIFVEGLKGFTMTGHQFKKRYNVLNPEILDNYFEKKQDVIAVATHYGNWEWGIQAVGSQLKHQAAALYKPLSNQYIEKFTKNLREKSGMKLVSIYDTKAYFQSEKEKPVLYIMAADQFPGDQIGKALWLEFLGRETPCLHGPESYARFNNLPVVFFNVQRVKRGFYTLEIKKLSEHPKDTQPGEITRLFMKSLEESVIAKPQDWLWSHKRWKLECKPETL